MGSIADLLVETVEIPLAFYNQQWFSCLNPPSKAVHHVATVLWEVDAFVQQLAKYKELSVLNVESFPVGVKFR